MKAPPAALALATAAMAAAATYAFDPSLGRQRRGVLKNQMSKLAREARRFGRVAARDLRNRTQGAKASIEHLGESATNVTDRVLVQRVRAKLGRYVSHPKAITVSAVRGNVDLSGHILSAEYATAIKAVSAVRGVRAVEDRLVVHPSAGSEPSLQGGKAPPGERSELNKRTWAPAFRLGAITLALALLAYAAAGRGPLRVRAGIVGALLVLRAFANRPLPELIDRPLDGREVPLAPPPEPGAWSVEES